MKSRILLNNLLPASFFIIVIWTSICYSIPDIKFSNLLFLLFPLNIFSLSLSIRPLRESSQKKRTAFGKKRMIVAIFCIGSLFFSGLYLTDFLSQTTFLIILFPWTIAFLLLQMFRNQFANALHKLLGVQDSICVIGNSEKSMQIANHLRQKKKFSSLRYFEHTELHSTSESNNDKNAVYSFNDFTKEKGTKELYVISALDHSLTDYDFFSKAEQHCIRINYIIPDRHHEFSLNGVQSHIKYIYGVPIWQRYSEPLRRATNCILKRTVDILVSGLVIIFILSWFIPFMGLLIKIESRGPVFFKQLRSGKNNQSFLCLKFRSMQINKDSDHRQATINDTRITKIGALLRRTSFDELPQFINVFRGDMSIVGPRPHMLCHTEEYSKQIKQYMSRLYLKPGITGWAQVNGYRGGTIDIGRMEKRVEYDIQYMENWSLWFDVKIMVLTFLNILKGEENAF